jgi:hypothetical protein
MAEGQGTWERYDEEIPVTAKSELLGILSNETPGLEKPPRESIGSVNETLVSTPVEGQAEVPVGANEVIALHDGPGDRGSDISDG